MSGKMPELCHVEGDRAGAAVPQCVSTSPCRRSGQRAANLLMKQHCHFWCDLGKYR